MKKLLLIVLLIVSCSKVPIINGEYVKKGGNPFNKESFVIVDAKEGWIKYVLKREFLVLRPDRYPFYMESEEFLRKFEYRGILDQPKLRDVVLVGDKWHTSFPYREMKIVSISGNTVTAELEGEMVEIPVDILTNYCTKL